MSAPDGLALQQRAFAALVTADEAPSAAGLLRPLAGTAPRLGVYRHAYRTRLIDALRQNVPVLHRAVGDDAFDELALGYLEQHPSRQPSIRWFGHALVDHLRRRPEALPHPALADLAAMEWALGCSFDAADREPLSFDRLASLPPRQWAEQRFAPHPSVSCLALQWAVEPMWQALTQDADAVVEEPEALAHTLLVWRQDLRTRWRSVAADETALLRACLGGACFAALCGLAAETQGTAAAPWVAAALRRWVEDGLLVEPAAGEP